MLAFAPNYDGSPIVFGQPHATSSAVGDHDMRARAGHHLAPQMLEDGSNAYDHLGIVFALFALNKMDIAGYREVARSLGLPLTIVRDPGTATRDAWGANLVLVRPDQYVVWTGDTRSDGIAHILAHAVARDAE